MTQRVAPAFASVASVLLFATCDFDKISGTPKPLSDADIAKVFSISPASDSLVTLGATKTLTLVAGTDVDLTNTVTRWQSSNPAAVAMDSLTGVLTGMTIGTATVTARLLSPELDTGYAQTRQMRVRYKGIKVAAIDSLPSKGFSRNVVVQGSNNSDQLQLPALTSATLSVHDSGSANTNVASVTTSAVVAKANGVAYVVALFDNFRDSVKVKVRQVAKSLTFPSVEYTATALNFNRTLPIVLRDLADSVMTTSPVMRWRSSDTTVVTIDSLTGVFRVKKTDTARIYVRVDTINVGLNNVAKSQKILVNQVVGLLNKFSVDPQTDTVAQMLGVLPAVTALDSGSTPVVGDTVIFRVGSGRGVITDSVKLTDANGRATLGSWRLGDTVGTNTVIATSGVATTTFTATGVADRPFALRFIEQPVNAAANASIGTVRVSVTDSVGNPVTSATSVTLAFANNPAGATFNGTKTVSAVNGIATFTGLNVSAAGAGYTLTATATGLSNAISDAFSIFGSPTKLAFLTPPSDVTAGVAMSPSVRVAIQDANGVTVTTSTAPVNLNFGTNAGSAPNLGVGNPVNAVAGIATFTPNIPNAANGYTLTATSTPLTPVTSGTFNVRSVGTPAKLVFLAGPPSTIASATAMSNITIRVEDQFGGLVTTSSTSVTLGFEVNAGNGTLSSPQSLTQAASGGIATFTGVNIDKAAAGYKLRATAASVTQATSNAFSVTPGPATKLGYIVNPTHINPGVVISPSVQVAIQDAAGNTVTSQAPTNVTVTSSTGTLSGTTQRATVTGVATFDNLSMAATASSVTLNASGGGLTAATSSPFAVVATSGGALKLRWVGTPSNTTAGSTLTSVQVEILDANNARVTTATNSLTVTALQVATNPGAFDGTSTLTAQASNGLATFGNLRLNTAGTYSITATGTGFPAVHSSTFTIGAGSPTNLGFLVQPPSTAAAGSPWTPAVKVAIRDQFFNTVTTATSNIGVGFQNSPSGAVLSGTTTKAAVAGIATFDNLSTTTAGGGFRLQATTNAGFTSASSSFFEVGAGTPVSLGFKVQPVNHVANATMASVEVSLLDAQNNIVTTATNPITIALSGGASNAVLGGTKTKTPVNGVATFSDLTIDKVGNTYRLNASAAGFSTVQSNTFNATFGSASQLVFSTQPVNRTGGEAFNVKVIILDAQGNTVTNSDRQINLNIQPGTGTSGATLGGTRPIFSSQGEATFNNMTVDKIGTGYKLQADASGVPSAFSNAFDIALGPKARVTFVDHPPASSNGGSVFATPVKVAITDLGGNVHTGATDQVTIARTANTGDNGATLSGTKTQNAVAGVATFGDLSMDRDANFYRLTASATGLASSESNNFNIVVGPAAKLVVQFHATNAVSLSAFNVQIEIADLGGNVVNVNQNVTMAIKTQPGGGTLGGSTTITSSNGFANFSNLTLNKAGTYTLEATSAGVTAVTTGNITVNAANPASLVWVTQPQATFVNAPLIPSGGVQPQIEVRDASGNLTNSSIDIRVQIATAPGAISLFNSSGNNCTEANGGNLFNCRFFSSAGVLSLPTLTLSGGTGDVTLKAFSPEINNSQTEFNSALFSLAAFDAPSKLGFTQQPTTTGYQVRINPALTVAVQDQWGNTVTNQGHGITLAIANDPNGGTTTLSGGGPTGALNGVATFDNVTLNKAGSGYTLSASATNVTSVTSSSFTIGSLGTVAQCCFNNKDMALAGGNLYWIDENANLLKTASATGVSASTVPSSPSLNDAVRIASDGIDVIWLERAGNAGSVGALKKMAVGGGGVTTLLGSLNEISDFPNSFAFDGVYVYFTAQSDALTGHAIKRVRVDPGQVDEIVSHANGNNPYRFTVSGGNIYYLDATGEIKRVPSTGGVPVTLAANGTGAFHMALVGTTLVVSSGDNLLTIPNASSISGPVTPTIHIASGANINQLRESGGSLYSITGNQIRRYQVSDMTFVNVTSSAPFWTSVVFDTNALFWYNGAIQKAAK